MADKSNEITALPKLLRAWSFPGIVTVDALGTQKQIAKEITEADANYVMALKGNHEVVHDEVKTFLDATVAEREARPVHPSTAAATLAVLETVDKDHGRLETRRYYQSAALDWFADRAQWEGLATVGMVEALREAREADGGTAVLSEQPAAGRGDLCAGGARALGDREQPALVLDVQMGEDDSRARTGYAAENLATPRRLALNH
ncbi:MAG: ISAs1 family transposase [Verrucomicrobiota bacterium]